MCDREMLSTTTKRSNWMREECFDPWGQDKDGHMGDGDAGMHDTSDPSSPCKVVVRCRKAQSPWERVVEAAVGTPVHVDVVLAQEGSAGARFCYSSYMNHKFEMIMMDKELIHDENINNISLDVTKEELEKCTQFMSCLSGKAAYSYFDAMVLMPMAPKPYADSDTVTSSKKMLSSFFNVMAEDEDSTDPERIKKVFCSQSVVLMLRYALDPSGVHSDLVEMLGQINSRLTSPKQIHHILVQCGAKPMSNEDLSNM